MAPPITYSIDGEQYVAVAVGFGGGGAAEGGAITHGWETPNKSRVLVFKLAGTQNLPPMRANDRTMPKPAAPAAIHSAKFFGPTPPTA